MRRRSYNSKLAVLTVVIAVILGTLLTRLDSAQQRAESQEKKSATDEFNRLFVDDVGKLAVNEGGSAIATAPNKFFAGSVAPKQAGDSLSGLGSRMQTNSVPYKAPTQIKDSTGLVRLPGEVPAGLSGATKLRRTKVADAPLTLTVVLNRTDQKGFDEFLRGVQNAQSPSYRRYLRPGEQADRFGPSQPEYVAVLGWLRQNGFTLVEGSANRLTLTVSAARAQAENAFGIRIGDYQVGDKIFYANDREPAVPAKIAPYVQAVIGLSNLGKPSAGKPDKAIKSASTNSPASQF
jgi:hypothetical protein